MSLTIEALYIYDDQDNCILEYVYSSRPPSPSSLLSALKASYPLPLRNSLPPILSLTSLQTPCILASITHSNLLLLSPTSSSTTDALSLLEFLHRVIDIFEDFLGSPLLALKIQGNYDVVAQLLNEICDGGVVCNTEPNALRENVEVATTITKLLSQVGLQPNSSSNLSSRGGAGGPGGNLAAQLKAQSSLNAPAIPWRRANVRHTSNELYVDLLETLSVILAPSGRPLRAAVTGSIVFTAKLSGVPDLVLVLSAPAGGSSSDKGSGIGKMLKAPVFHPCVRLSRWGTGTGELSFVPPDGRFVLGGYEVDLLPEDKDAAATVNSRSDKKASPSSRLFLPASVDLLTNLGSKGTEFEARLTMNTNFPGIPTRPTGTHSSSSRGSGPGFSFLPPSSSATSTNPTLEGVSVSIPLPATVSSVTDLRATKGEAHFQPLIRTVVWKVPTNTRDLPSQGGPTISLTGRLVGASVATNMDDDGEDVELQSPTGFRSAYDYDEDEPKTKSKAKAKTNTTARAKSSPTDTAEQQRRNRITNKLMPRSVSVSFIVRGWVPSGLRVEKLEVVRGGAEGVRPFKGVKYLTVSREGVERRVG